MTSAAATLPPPLNAALGVVTALCVLVAILAANRPRR